MEKKTDKKEKGRHLPVLTNKSIRAVLVHALLSITFYCSPAFSFSSCTISGDIRETPPYEHEETEIILDFGNIHEISAPGRYGTVDIFIFNNDPLKRIDSYQRIDLKDGMTLKAVSRKGHKRVVAIANPHKDSYGWDEINSYGSFQLMSAYLRCEDPSLPIMSGETEIEAGTDTHCSISLKPMLSEIFLRSIRCDFSGRPYSGAEMSDIWIYLTNVNAEAPVMKVSGFTPVKMHNMYGLDESGLEEFSHPEMVVRHVDGNAGYTALRTDIALYAYPNECTEESAGSPFTRLIIEGTINGERYYYPVNINREDSGHVFGAGGISRNCRYIFDITIRRTGTGDPDMAVSSETADIDCSIVPWRETDETEIPFRS